MYIKQFSVFIENTPGRLAEFTKLLAEHDIDLIALTIADTTHFGIVRGLVNDYERAKEIITAAGFTVRLTDVLAVAVPDTPGGLARIVTLLSAHNIGIEYLYSFVRRVGENAVIVFRVEELERAIEVLRENDVRLLGQEEMRGL